MTRGGVTFARDVVIEEQTWGRLEWMVAGRLGNSDTLTVGRCYIKPGRSNPLHHHPNCDEVLHVLHGAIDHRVDDGTVRLEAGDTISIPAGAVHQAANIGRDEAVLVIAFSTPERKTVGE